MCGFIFTNNTNFGKQAFKSALSAQAWRGPDAQSVETSSNNLLGHVRLAIVDPQASSDQPFLSRSKRYSIIYNGEIYNHQYIRKKLRLKCRTLSDTDTIIEGFVQKGPEIFRYLDGMFSLVISDNLTGDWWAARDAFGIKPLFISARAGQFILSSETISIRILLAEEEVDSDSIAEWRLVRRPLRGRTFFKGIDEVLPGTVLHNGTQIDLLSKRWDSGYLEPLRKTEAFQDDVEAFLQESVLQHEMSDVKNVCLLSGGIDSTLIVDLSTVEKAYTVGLADNNEFANAQKTADHLDKQLQAVTVSLEKLQEQWRWLIRLRGEPLSVPNEGLIFSVCSQMAPHEKVVLTGEGADELFFGYDNIFRWAASLAEPPTVEAFLEKYGYANISCATPRLIADIISFRQGKSAIEFVEDYFFHYHLPTLLRRMDAASMAASKEARVPFVCRRLFDLLYRHQHEDKISGDASKIPLRQFLSKKGYNHVLETKKIGFSATPEYATGKIDEYQKFQQFNLKELGWL